VELGPQKKKNLNPHSNAMKKNLITNLNPLLIAQTTKEKEIMSSQSMKNTMIEAMVEVVDEVDAGVVTMTEAMTEAGVAAVVVLMTVVGVEVTTIGVTMIEDGVEAIMIEDEVEAIMIGVVVATMIFHLEVEAVVVEVEEAIQTIMMRVMVIMSLKGLLNHSMNMKHQHLQNNPQSSPTIVKLSAFLDSKDNMRRELKQGSKSLV
jgi:hypothetical protein